jgi:hypothetical protein
LRIRDSRKFRHVLVAAGSVCAVYALLSLTLIGLAARSERTATAYPWRSEDYLRYLLPSLFARHDRDWQFITGPSEAREDFLHERFDVAFQGVSTYQGGLSLGTLDDLLIVLDYLEGAYGAQALPRSLVVGITPRFVANITHGVSPLAQAINRYSPRFRVEPANDGPRLHEKTRPEGLLSRLRFLSKQQGRYHAAVCATVLRQLERVTNLPPSPWLAPLDQAPDRVDIQTVDGLLRLCRAPYKYHHLRPMTRAVISGWMSDTNSIWYKVHQWEPERDAFNVSTRLTRLRETCHRLGIDLYVVNLPEHPMNRVRYQPGRYEAYLNLVRGSLGDTPFLDLRELLSAEEFYDAGHATLRGAIVVTDRTIEFLRAYPSFQQLLKASRSD